MHQKHQSCFAQLLRPRKSLRRPHRLRKGTLEIDLAATSLKAWHAFRKASFNDAAAIPAFAKMVGTQKDIILVEGMANIFGRDSSAQGRESRKPFREGGG